MSNTHTGMVCKECKSPFWVWSSDAEIEKADENRVQMYLDYGHTKELLTKEQVDDVKNWCHCQHDKEV